MTHWAHQLVGTPWSEQFDCWALVRRVFREQHGIALPEHAAGVLSLSEAAHASGWRPADAPPRAGDVVLMRTMQKRRHVGVLVEVNRKTMVLHNDGRMTKHGPIGQVVLSSLSDLVEQGCNDFEFWRKQ